MSNHADLLLELSETSSSITRSVQLREAAEYIAGLERQLTSMRASFHVNMVRAFPAKSHEEISAEIDRALEITGVRK